MANPVRSAAENAVSTKGLVKEFGSRRVLDGLDLEVRAGEFVALLGRSGCGKSTLLRVLAGLDTEVGGEFSVPGTVSVAFQQPRLLPWRKVWRNVSLGLKGVDRPKNWQRAVAEKALAEVRLADHADAWPLTLSGGEAQRVSLARALVREPDLLLLDEPFGALDALTRAAMHRLVEQLWREHRPAVLFVTHDVDEALLLADRVLVLDTGRIVAEHVVDQPRPRRRKSLVDLRGKVLSDLGVDDAEAA
ncbi:sulfonate transport system ATP-binding protein [Saccharothrix coeruleofusca]|uniref:ABC transporter ATP-binding protein n=1 Tax=Saccharothrix coeruleofusca TaxID=33919 RepID=UPI0027DC4F02|nr:ABC transporter ATP-binding protein [Saccharothrix coeruleofusca]MBP2339735.1 sulfonate transport system ATP-binding protein [Saccharothrix coeruleofusca]